MSSDEFQNQLPAQQISSQTKHKYCRALCIRYTLVRGWTISRYQETVLTRRSSFVYVLLVPTFWLISQSAASASCSAACTCLSTSLATNVAIVVEDYRYGLNPNDCDVFQGRWLHKERVPLPRGINSIQSWLRCALFMSEAHKRKMTTPRLQNISLPIRLYFERNVLFKKSKGHCPR